MKKNILILPAAALLLTGCLADLGGNDYDSVLPEMEITIPETAYSTSLGSTITITPVIKTDIPESDLQYFWEAMGDRKNAEGVKDFTSLVPDEEQARELVYTGKFDDNITTLNLSYECRLRVHQISTGRDFFSAGTFTITISGVTGLMVLYGDSNSSDVGLVQAEEFTPQAMSIPEKPSALASLYSANNAGNTIPGKGVEIQQITSFYFTTYLAYYPQILGPRCGHILARTDQDARWLGKDGFVELGDWNYMFYAKGEQAMNQNKPKGFKVNMIYFYGFDGDEMYSCNTLSSFPFLFSEFDASSTFADGHSFTFEPEIIFTGGSKGYPNIMYAKSVDGNTARKGFVGIRSAQPGYFRSYGYLLDTGDDAVAKFNTGNMNADLVKMRRDGRQHVMAVLKGDSGNAKYAGKLFLVDLNTTAPALAGATTAYSGIGEYAYDLSGMQDINDAFSFEFGWTQTMCYYATKNGVYHYQHDGAGITAAAPLTMTDGSSWSAGGEITMMKMLDTGRDYQDNTPNHNPTQSIMMVATFSSGKAALWALHLDSMSGRISKAVKYDSQVEGWAFDKPILDASIKVQ